VFFADKKERPFSLPSGRVDKKLQDMIQETQGSFHQYAYHDRKTGTFCCCGWRTGDSPLWQDKKMLSLMKSYWLFK